MTLFHTIRARNVNDALISGLYLLAGTGILNQSRNGPVLVVPGPVATTYDRPLERVLFHPTRDANPFFHLYEAVWMLAGRNDAGSVGRYAKQMEMYAGEDGLLWGAYGFRWRHFFYNDQLQHIAELLRKDRSTRRAVLTMWSPEGDLWNPDAAVNEGVYASKDVPCNTHVYFDATRGVLDMTVCNRSNDVIWGAYGANMVHMSFLQEVIAAAVGVPVGVYHQVSNNYHVYTERPDVERLIFKDGGLFHVGISELDPYTEDQVPWPLADQGPLHLSEFLTDCEAASEFPTADHHQRHQFFPQVFVPMMRAHAEYKLGDYAGAAQELQRCQAKDWRRVAYEWLGRRATKAARGEA